MFCSYHALIRRDSARRRCIKDDAPKSHHHSRLALCLFVSVARVAGTCLLCVLSKQFWRTQHMHDAECFSTYTLLFPPLSLPSFSLGPFAICHLRSGTAACEPNSSRLGHPALTVPLLVAFCFSSRESTSVPIACYSCCCSSLPALATSSAPSAVGCTGLFS